VSARDPLKELAALQQLVGDVIGLGGDPGGPWVPALDVREVGDELVLCLDAPGMHPEDFTLEVDEETLFIKGTRERDPHERGDRFHRAERRFGSFTRTVPLPKGSDVRAISAQYADGVLEVRVPSVDESLPRRLRVAEILD
jgi:HSP20 family protein